MADRWTDIALHPLGIARVISVGNTVEAWINDTRAWKQLVATDLVRFLRCAVSPQGIIAAVGQGGEGNEWRVHENIALTVGPTHGTMPCAVRHDGTQFVFYRVTGLTTYLVNGVQHNDKPPSVEGIREVLPDGTIIWEQPTFGAVFGGRRYGQFTHKDGWIVGQVEVPGEQNIGAFHEASGKHYKVKKGPPAGAVAEGIHFVLVNGWPHVVALTEQGDFSRRISAADEWPLEAPQPPDPQPPQPPQPPEPPRPPITMQFTDAQKQTLIAIGEKFPDLRRSPDDEQRRAFNMRLAQQFRHSYGERWGTKRADPGRPLSKDAIAFKNGDGFFSFDTVNGTTREVNPEAEGEFLTDQVYVPVEPQDWLGDAPEPPDTPVPPTPNLEPRVAALEASFAMAQGRVDLLADRVVTLEAEVPPAGVSEARVQELIAAALAGLKVEGSTSRSLAHSHNVNLKVTRG